MDVSAALVAGWARVINRIGRGRFIDELGATDRNATRWLGEGTLPELHTVLNSLTIDATALDELAALYGMEIRPREAALGNDMAMIACVARLAAQWADVMADGVRDHRETLDLARALRPLMPQFNAILAEAERLAAPVRA